MGVSGQLMLRALAEGTEDDPAVLAEFAKGTVRKKLALLLCWPFGSSVHLMSVRGAPGRRPALR